MRCQGLKLIVTIAFLQIVLRPEDVIALSNVAWNSESLVRKVRTNPARCIVGIYQNCVFCSAWPESDGSMGDELCLVILGLC